jgi:hypothetical protein
MDFIFGTPSTKGSLGWFGYAHQPTFGRERESSFKAKIHFALAFCRQKKFNFQQPTQRFIMAKKTPILAIVICLMMMLPSHANATWLATLINGGILVSKKIVSLLQEKDKVLGVQASPSPTAKAAPQPKPTQEEVEDALGQLGNACQTISSKGIPCAISYAKGCTRSSALRVANTRSIQALGESMSSYVTGELNDAIANEVEGGGIGLDREVFSGALKSTVNAQVNNSQIFLSHTLQRKSKDCKGSGEEFEVVTVRVINAAPGIFEEALVETSLGEEIGKGLIDASLKFIANKANENYKKRK